WLTGGDRIRRNAQRWMKSGCLSRVSVLLGCSVNATALCVSGAEWWFCQPHQYQQDHENPGRQPENFIG
ncbi:MAG: hypothetical protein N6V49_13755, partial [Serratia symbiotica]|nr:hypothetical protein [Serratia symbiotica]